MSSILKARSRLQQKFFQPDTVVIHPRDIIKFELAQDANGLYIWPNGIRNQLAPATVVVDANVPTNLGAGTNESVIMVGDFKNACYFFTRQALTIEGSRHAGWTTNETVFRGEERYGFAVVVPSALELLTGITP
jgi:HK97 family phage major capsid protein